MLRERELRQESKPLATRVNGVNFWKLERLTLLVYSILIAALATILVSLREFPLGHDPYFYLAFIGQPQPGFPPLFFYVLQFIDLNLIVFLATATIIFFFGLIVRERGAAQESSLPLMFLLAAPAFTFRLAFLEDDLIGVPLCLIAVWLYLKNRKHEAFALLAISALVAWRGCLLFLGFLAFNEVRERTKLAWLALPVLALFVRPDAIVGENSLGFLFIPITLLSVTLGLLNWKSASGFNKAWSAWFLALGILSAKWLWLAVFPLAIMLSDLVQNSNRRDGFVVMVVGLGLFIGSLFVLNAAPTGAQLHDIQMVVDICGSSEINNEWWLGHWLRYNGGNPRYSNLKHTPEAYMPGPAACHLTNSTLGLPLVRDFGWIRLYQDPGIPTSP